MDVIASYDLGATALCASPSIFHSSSKPRASLVYWLVLNESPPPPPKAP
jgi:hypothetical protein